MHNSEIRRSYNGVVANLELGNAWAVCILAALVLGGIVVLGGTTRRRRRRSLRPEGPKIEA